MLGAILERAVRKNVVKKLFYLIVFFILFSFDVYANNKIMFCPQKIKCNVGKSFFSTVCKPSPRHFENWVAWINDHLPSHADHHMTAIFTGVFIRVAGPMNCQYRFKQYVLGLSPPQKIHYIPVDNHLHWKQHGRNYFCENRMKASECPFRLSK